MNINYEFLECNMSILDCFVFSYLFNLAPSIQIYQTSFPSAMVLEVYSAYVNNFSSAMETVKRCARKEPQFAEYLSMRQSQSPDKLSLFGLMVKPVQRFPQYILQFQDLLKNTPSDHNDRLLTTKGWD